MILVWIVIRAGIIPRRIDYRDTGCAFIPAFILFKKQILF